MTEQWKEAYKYEHYTGEVVGDIDDDHKEVQTKIRDVIEELERTRKHEKELLELLMNLQEQEFERSELVRNRYRNLLEKARREHEEFKEQANQDVERAETNEMGYRNLLWETEDRAVYAENLVTELRNENAYQAWQDDMESNSTSGTD